MLEESKMDKKSLNRSSQPQSRASGIDCKKGPEVTHKPWPKANKKREGPAGAPKNEPRKNGAAQRGRGQIDRRPRARGNPSNINVGGVENARIEDDDEPEIGSVFVPGSKKQNLNHLLNFMYPSRGGQERKGALPRRHLQHQIPHRYEHDLYLRAYCQFVVREDGDYKAVIIDPDIPLKWDEIEEIVVRGTGKSECPICLGAPAAARVGVCGHVYCWACVLHYAAAHEKQPPPCPVCTTPMHVKNMKPTIMLQWEPPAEEVTMRLVRRLRGSTVVEVAPPRGQLTFEDIPSILPLANINKAPYCKLFSASKQQVQEILERERREIQKQIMAEIDTTEIVYLEQALEMLKKKEEEIKNQYIKTKAAKDADDEVPIVYEKSEQSQNKFDWFDVSEEGAACIDNIQDQMEQLEVAASQELNPHAPEFIICDINDNAPSDYRVIECEREDNCVTDIDKQNQAKYFYFYQAEDGQQVFLSSLNVRMMNASWGALAAAPLVIQGRVLHRDTLSLNEQTRKHIPFTAHLPLHCSFEIVELDLQPPHVTNAALKSFADELDRRARTRARNEREERRRERAYRRAMEGPPKPDFSSELMFPAPSHMSPPLSDPVLPPIHVPYEGQEEASSSSTPSGLSFAKMARTSGTWRVRAPVPVAPVEVPDEENSGPRALSLSDAIEAAFHAAPSPSQSSKKNKKKQKILFTTGMHRTS